MNEIKLIVCKFMIKNDDRFMLEIIREERSSLAE